MKSIKFILGTLAVAGLLGFSQGASAQENGNRDENGKVVRGPYETNGFWDNWFIGVGAGVNSVADKGVKFGIGGLATDLNLGKWITPSFGARIGWKGLTNSYEFSDKKGGLDFNQNYIHADALWNISNSIGGYKETRFWDFVPYATTGVFMMKEDAKNSKNALEYAAGVGLLNDLRLSKRVDLFIDLSALVIRAQQLGTGDRFAFMPSATAGLIFNLGRTNFDRHSSVTPVVVPLPFTTEQYNALKDRVAELEKENAALKDEIEALKNRKPETVYVEKAVFEPVSRTFFDLGSSVISAREKAHLDYFASKIADSDKTITVKGYADSATGSSATNQRLSEARANAVKNYLVKNCGIDASRIEVVAVGGTAEFGKPNSNNRTVVVE